MQSDFLNQHIDILKPSGGLIETGYLITSKNNLFIGPMKKQRIRNYFGKILWQIGIKDHEKIIIDGEEIII